MSYVVRHGEWSEREQIVDLYIKNLWHIAHLEPDLETVFKSIYHAIDARRLFVCERDGQIIGCTSYAMGTFWYTPKEMLFDTGFFIVPEFRKTRAASLLLNALKAEAKRLGTVLIMGAGTKDKTVAPIMAKRYQQIAAAFVVRH